MPPSCSPFRCFVVLLLVAAAGLLARPAEASKRLFAGIVDAAAERHGVDPDLVHAVIAVESGYRATAQSPAGAQGLMQLMPGTQRDLGVADAFDPRQNVDAGVAYLRRLTDEFGTVLALAAYNAGPGAVRRYNGIPPYAQTRAYVRAVLDRGRRPAVEEHDPSKDRALAVSEADVTEDAAPADRRLQDDHLAMDAAAGLQPRMLDAALDPDYRTRTAAPPDQLVIPRAGCSGGGARPGCRRTPLPRHQRLEPLVVVVQRLRLRHQLHHSLLRARVAHLDPVALDHHARRQARQAPRERFHRNRYPNAGQPRLPQLGHQMLAPGLLPAKLRALPVRPQGAGARPIRLGAGQLLQRDDGPGPSSPSRRLS